MKIARRQLSTDCPIELVLSILGGKWKAIIVYYLLKEDVMRFKALQKEMPPITHQMLTTQLRELEGDGLVQRLVYPQVPPKVEYSLTDLGKSLHPLIQAMVDWGHRYETESGSAFPSNS